MKDPSAAPRPQDSFVAGAEQRRDRHLVRLLLGVQHEQLLHRVDRPLQLVTRALPFDLQVLDGPLQVCHARHGLRGQPLREQLRVLDDQLRFLLRVRLHVLGHLLREELDEHNARERILKDTLLSAQKVSEDVKANAQKEAELIVKDAELLSERLTGQAMDRLADLERTIQDLKMERKMARNKLQTTIDTIQQLLMLDAEQEANEMPITSLFRARNE